LHFALGWLRGLLDLLGESALLSLIILFFFFFFFLFSGFGALLGGRGCRLGLGLGLGGGGGGGGGGCGLLGLGLGLRLFLLFLLFPLKALFVGTLLLLLGGLETRERNTRTRARTRKA
jgi:hypothetical protein